MRRRARVNRGLVRSCAIAVSLVARAALADSPYTVLDLGTFGGNESKAYDINNTGRITGFGRSTVGVEFAFRTSPYAAINPATDNLGTITGGTFSEGWSINPSGSVAGLGDSSGGDRAFRYTGTMQNLGTLAGNWSYAYGINAGNQVVGDSAYTTSPASETHAFLYSGTQMFDLSTLGGNQAGLNSWGRAINQNGAVVGYSHFDPGSGGLQHAFIWTPSVTNGTTGSMSDLGTLGGGYSYAWGINNAGYIVGESTLPGDSQTHAFGYVGGVMSDLGTLGGSFSEAWDVNAAGDIVGSAADGTEQKRAFIYSGGTMSDLNAMIPAGTGWMLQYAQAINDNGDIVGYGMNPSGDIHAFVLMTESAWNVNASGNWSVASNWLHGVPNAVGKAVKFGPIIMAPRTVTVNTPSTLGRIQFDSAFSYTLAGSSLITMDASGIDASISVVQGSHTIASPVVLKHETEVKIQSGTALTITGSIASTGSAGLIKSGAGTLAVRSIALASLNIDEGTVQVQRRAVTGGNRPARIDSLTVAGGGAPVAALDLNDNDLVVQYGTGPNPFFGIRDLVFAGFSSTPDPSKMGIISTTGQSAGNTILALFDNALVGAADWPLGSGQTIDANSVIGKYTYFGDMNLDGQVTPDDYGILDANFGTTPDPGIAWLSGDANLDFSVTADDYGILDANLGSGTGGPLSVPEPAPALGLIALSGIVALRPHQKARR